jgi:hypothetical protein
MSNIRIDIASEFKETGFKKAQKSTDKLNKSFNNLGRTARRTFIAVAGIQALKRSVIAFAEEEKAAVKLAQSLRNLGLAYNTKAIEDYLEKTEKATAISKDELSPAIAQLVTTTLNAEKSMALLNVAMDVSAATGKDLRAVTSALSRAYNGNYASLGKLQTAYTTAELEAMGFNKAINALSEQFKGSAAASATSYSAKIDLLKIAFGDSAEELGKGIIGGLEQLNNGNYTTGLEAIVKVGSFIGDVFRRAGVTIAYTKELLKTGFRIDPEEQRRLDEIKALFSNPEAASNRMGNNPASNREFLADYKKQQDLQKKIEADRKKAAAMAAKAEKDRLKREREALALKRAGTVFDMENIQIVAAMQNKVTEDQLLRLTALLAINTGNAAAAEKLSMAVLAANGAALQSIGVMITAGDTIDTVIQKIIASQTNLALVGKGIGDIPKAPNPFQDWPSIIAGILAQIGTVKGALAGLGSPSIGGSAGGNNGNSGVGGNTVKVPSAITPPAGVNPDTSLGGGFNIKPGQYPNSSYFAGVAATSPYMPSSYFAGLAADSAAREEAAARRAAGPYMSSSYFAGMPAGNTPAVVVNVSGSVISENDLKTVIIDTVNSANSSGTPLNFNRIVE